MAESLRLYFLLFYAIGVAVLLVKVIPSAFRTAPGEIKAPGARRILPALLLPWNWLVPPLLILLRLGEITAAWTPLRIAGVALSLYAAGFLLWATATLGRFLVPQAVVFRDHELVTSGPLRYVRHPAYSGDLALWLAAALGTLNVGLLLLWPLAVIGTSLQARVEEELLRAKFGASYESYVRRTPRFIPRPRLPKG
jgi:protein-S-isoprenylcysteine O-methyltransferase Ste14